MTWLMEGDLDSHFIHHTVMVQRSKNLIADIQHFDWLLHIDRVEIAIKFLDYFKL